MLFFTLDRLWENVTGFDSVGIVAVCLEVFGTIQFFIELFMNTLMKNSSMKTFYSVKPGRENLHSV